MDGWILVEVNVKVEVELEVDENIDRRSGEGRKK